MAQESDPLARARHFLGQQLPGMALAVCQTHLTKQPGDAAGWHLLAQIQLGLNAVQSAEQSIQRALALSADAEFMTTRDTIEAIKLTMQSIALKQRGDQRQAFANLRRAAELLPEASWPQNNLADHYFAQGDVERAIVYFRRAAEHPQAALRVAHSNLLFAMMHSDRETPDSMLAEHRRWVARYAPVAVAPPPLHSPDPERPIRLGYSSPDFCEHPIALFIRGVLEQHDPERFHVTCYADGGRNDAVTRQLRSCGQQWVESTAMTLEQLFARIRADQIDILIDLAVHSGFNRQRLLAERPAPLQMTWLGYAGTTGSPAMDYRITDAVMDPPGLTESHFTERLLRLPDIFWCFTPFDRSPAVSERAASAHGPLRIGSAIRLAKASPSCLDLWCRLLQQAPNTLLCLAAEGFGDPECVAQWTAHFVRRGVDPARLQLTPALGMAEYLAFLSSLDIGLDTFPYNGGTTVCQTLWMGTPVVALSGQTSAARVTASILQALGRDSWIAPDAEAWLAINLRLVHSPTERAEARANLRAGFQSSTLGDSRKFTRQYEAALREVFAQRCREQET